MNLICPKCYKSFNVLTAFEKINRVDGYFQCKDCYSDLDYEGVVIRQIHFDKRKNNGTPLPKWLNDDLEKKGLNRKISCCK